MEAVKIASGGLELLDPFMGLHYHHVAVKSTLPKGLGWAVHMGPDLGDHRGAKGHVGDKVAVHDIDVQPIGPLRDLC